MTITKTKTDFVQDLVNEGIEKRKNGDLQGAIKDLTEVINQDSSQHIAFFNLGFCKQLNYDFDQAIDLYSAAIRLDYNDAFSFNNRGICYTELKDYPRAIIDFSKAIKRNSKVIEFYKNRAEAYEKNGNYKKAITDLTKFLKKNACEDALSKRAYLRYLLGNYKLAIKDYEKLSKVFQQDNSKILLNAKRLQQEIDDEKLAKENELKRKEEEEKIQYRNKLSLFAEFNTDLDVDYVEENRNIRELIYAAGLDETNRKGPSKSIVKEIFPAGIYVIDDLSRRIVDQTNREEVDHYVAEIGMEVNGISVGDRGTKYSNIETLFGEGDYKDNYGWSYEVRKSIGCISHKEVEVSDYDEVAVFPKPFNVNYDRNTGIIRFGSVFIDTDYRYMGQRDIYFYDETNLYEPDHPENKDNKAIRVLFKPYYQVKELDPKPVETVNWQLAKYIDRELSLTGPEKTTAITDKILGFLSGEMKSFQDIDNSKLTTIISSDLSLAKKDLKQWSINIYKKFSILKSNEGNIDSRGRAAKPLKVSFNEKFIINEINFKRIERIIDHCIDLLKEG